jgi:putative membrane protein
MCIDLHEALGWWTADPLAIGASAVSSAVYFTGVKKLWRRVGAGRGLGPKEVACFVAGQLALLVALVSPVDRLSDLLFSAHMTQHEIILLIAPPLVVLGRPELAALWALPDLGRRRLAAALRVGRWSSVWRFLTSPFVSLVLHGFVVWVWHVPSLFEAAMRSEAVHAIQHGSFFATGALFWWAILRGRYGRAGYGLAVLFVFATAAHTSILGALLTVADRVYYPIYGHRGAALDLDPVSDQQLAGLVMWIPAGTALVLGALALFVAWLGESARRVAAAERRRAARDNATVRL